MCVCLGLVTGVDVRGIGVLWVCWFVLVGDDVLCAFGLEVRRKRKKKMKK